MTTRSLQPELYLASKSPRRQQLLKQVGVTFYKLCLDYQEKVVPGDSAEATVCRLAEEKAEAGWKHKHRQLNLPVLGADTLVKHSGRMLGKPENLSQAKEILRLLSGSKHEVVSAICMIQDDKKVSMLSSSTVFFREISGLEIEHYWASGEPADKAGAYAIQGIGAVFIKRIEGSYSGVMGLPIYETGQLLKKFNIEIL